MTQQTFKLGDPVTCLVYGDGHICEFDELTDNPLAMWVSFGFQPDSIPYTFDGRLHRKANITLRHTGSQSLQEMMISEGSAIPDKVAYLQSNGWQSYKHHDNWVKCNWSEVEKDNSFLDLNSAYERCVKGQEGCIRHKSHFQVSEPFKDFRYAVGTDCWLVKKGYELQLYRCFIAARILEEESLLVKRIYRVRLEGTPTLIEAYEEELFDTLTSCNDALSAYSDLLQKQNS